MPVGIGASVPTLTNGTTADGPTVANGMASLNSNGVSNDGGAISTSGSGDITATSFKPAAGGTILGVVGGNLGTTGAHTISLPWNTGAYRVCITPNNSVTAGYFVSAKTNTSVTITVPSGGNCDYLIIAGV